MKFLNLISLLQACYFTEATKAIDPMPPCHCLGALKMLQKLILIGPRGIGVPFTKEKMPWCPCPFKQKHTGLLLWWFFLLWTLSRRLGGDKYSPPSDHGFLNWFISHKHVVMLTDKETYLVKNALVSISQYCFICVVVDVFSIGLHTVGICNCQWSDPVLIFVTVQTFKASSHQESTPPTQNPCTVLFLA